MKTKTNTLLAILLFSSSIIFAQNQSINTEKSTIEWNGKKKNGEHTGNINLKKGYLELSENKIISGSFEVDMASITSTDIQNKAMNKKLVNHLKSDDFFGVDSHPTATFTVTNSTQFSSGKARLNGDITIKGHTENISFDVVRDQNSYTAILNLSRSKFDITYGANNIEDIFVLDIKLSLE